MKKFFLAAVVSVFAASTAYACDGMKGHNKGDKADQGATQSDSSAKKDGKSGTKSDQKS